MALAYGTAQIVVGIVFAVLAACLAAAFTVVALRSRPEVAAGRVQEIVNFRLHNTLWVPGHFHTYLMLGILFWALALLVHLLERAGGRPAGRLPARLATACLLVGGYGLVASWFVSGALGVPRRYAVQPPGSDGYSLAGAIFALVFALGFLVLLIEAGALGRAALATRRAAATGDDGRAAVSEPHAVSPLEPLLATPAQIAAAVAMAVVAIGAFLPAVTEVAEVAAAVLAPAGMLVMMPPVVYESVEGHPAEHALYHVGIAATGLAPGSAAGCWGASPAG